MFTDGIKGATVLVATGAEALAGLVITIAVVEAAIRIAGLLFTRGHSRAPGSSHDEAMEDIRLRLGRWLALALEVELGADILRTAVAPTWSEIGQLAAVAAIRTALNYFLQREIDGAVARKGVAGTTGAARTPVGDS